MRATAEAVLREVLGAGALVLRTLLYLAAAVVLLGALAHALTWLCFHRRAARWVWNAWNLVGTGLLAAGVAAMGYGWLGLGLDTGAGSALAGFGLLLASAGLWMLVPL